MFGHFPTKLGPETRSGGSDPAKLVQNMPKISPGDQFQGHVVEVSVDRNADPKRSAAYLLRSQPTISEFAAAADN